MDQENQTESNDIKWASTWAFDALLAIALNVLMLAKPGNSSIKWFGLNLCVMFYVLPPFIILHELGHFFCARLMGFQIESVNFGRGRIVFSWILFGSKFNLRAQSGCGDVGIYFEKCSRGSWREIAIVFAGPFVNLALAAAAAIILWAAPWRGITSIVERLDILPMCLFANLVLVFASFSIRSGANADLNKGFRLLMQRILRNSSC